MIQPKQPDFQFSVYTLFFSYVHYLFSVDFTESFGDEGDKHSMVFTSQTHSPLPQSSQQISQGALICTLHTVYVLAYYCQAKLWLEEDLSFSKGKAEAE